MKKKDSKYVYIAMCIVFVVALIIIAVSLTYAFILPTIEGTETQSNLKTSLFDIETSLTSESAIEALNIYPIDESQVPNFAPNVKFTAKAKATNRADGKFIVYLKDIAISNNFIASDFKWQLLMDNEIIASGNFSDIETKGISSTTKTDTATMKYFDRYDLGTRAFNGSNQSNFEVRVYLLNNNTNQNSLTNGSFDAKVAIEGNTNN